MNSLPLAGFGFPPGEFAAPLAAIGCDGRTPRVGCVMRSSLLAFALLALPSASAPAADVSDPMVLRQVAIGSCHRTGPKSEAAFAAIAASKPDAFLFLGDNIYGDTRDMKVMREKYDAFAAVASWKQLRQSTRVLATWDDHDYGENDAGAEFPQRAESAALFKEVFAFPPPHPIHTREGVYHSATFGPEGRRVQILLLDTRSFRSPLRQERIDGRKTYLPDPDPAKSLLGPAQWKWLEEQLAEPAEVRVIGSSIQILPEEHRFEKWANLPAERTRLLDKLATTKGRLVLLSGDRHLGEFSRLSHRGIGLVEMTTSGMTHAGGGRGPGGVAEPNRHRVGDLVSDLNWGTLAFEWKDQAPPALRLDLRDPAGRSLGHCQW